MTEVICKICNEKIRFDPNNSNTYIHKTESGNLMVGKLYTIRLSHFTDSGSSHINVVVVDENGEYRAHKDYYEEKISLKGAPDQWNKLHRCIPLELRIYLPLASEEDKIILSTIPEPLEKSPQEWYDCLIDLWQSNSDNQLINFLAVKWGFIIGKGKELIKYNYKPNSWSYPIYLRLQARFSPSSELIQIAKRIDFISAPLIIQLEEAVAKSEVFLRLSVYDLLEQLYDDCQKKWGDQTSIEVKTGLMFLQGYYGFRLYFLGKINEAL
ncbi:MAG: hypothetical protein ACFFAA_07870, partial [Promethearchaeota archaeon]